MGSFEWMELQTLNGEIADARSRLVAARSSRNPRVARGLEGEIIAAEARRTRLLAHLTTHLAANPEPALDPTMAEGATPQPSLAAAEESLPDDTGAEEQSRAVADLNLADSAAAPAPAPQPDSVKGGLIVWEKLTPGDIARATDELGARRAETLARHAEELKGLEADRSEIESLEQAIDEFVRRFPPSAREPDIAMLGQEGDLRLQAHG